MTFDSWNFDNHGVTQIIKFDVYDKKMTLKTIKYQVDNVLNSKERQIKMRYNLSLIIFLILITKISFGQSIIDSCFSSVVPSTTFTSSLNLANMGPDQSDLIEWTGTAWIGGWPTANLTIPPPVNTVGCRAIFIGNATTWTTGGEGFGLQLNSPLIVGQTYSFIFNYVSHGTGSNGVFNPSFYTNSSPVLGYLVGNLPAVGYMWTTNTFSFTATSAQSGHTWIIITTAPSGSSGLINSFCKACNDTTSVNCSVNLGNDTTLCQGDNIILNATTSNATYQWQDNSTNPTYTVSQQGTYWVNVTVNNCSMTDSLTVESKECEIILEMPNVFTLNNDGTNDYFHPVKLKGIDQASLKIYNRWGQKLFETSNILTGWDGKYYGQECTEGTYFWIIQYATITNESKTLTGFLTLIK